MSVFKRPGSPFYYYQFMYDGRRYRGSTNETGPYKARQFENMKMEAVRRGETHTGKPLRLSELAIEFTNFARKSVKAKQLSQSTCDYYENGLRLLRPTQVWKDRVDRITTEDAKTLAFPGSPSNANNALRTLRRVLSFAKDRKMLSYIPEIPLLEENGREALLNQVHEAVFLEFARSPLREAIIIMLDSFMRPDEVCRIQWSDIHWDQSQIFIRSGKTRKARRFVGLTKRMKHELLTRQQNDSDSEGGTKSPWVFPSDKSGTGHLLPGSLTRAWKNTAARVMIECKKRGLPPLPEGLALYSCRHTGLTNFNAVSGGDQAKLMRVAGHSNIHTTQRYLHPSISDAAELMNQHNRTKASLQAVETRAAEIIDGAEKQTATKRSQEGRRRVRSENLPARIDVET